MKHLCLLLFPILLSTLHGEELTIVTLEYPMHQGTYIKLNKIWGDDPFSEKESKKKTEEGGILPVSSIEMQIARALEIELTESNGKYLLFDGESIYARISRPEHKKLETAMDIKGIVVSAERESKALKVLALKKEGPNQSQ
jgi:hypothetical protein